MEYCFQEIRIYFQFKPYINLEHSNYLLFSNGGFLLKCNDFSIIAIFIFLQGCHRSNCFGKKFAMCHDCISRDLVISHMETTLTPRVLYQTSLYGKVVEPKRNIFFECYFKHVKELQFFQKNSIDMKISKNKYKVCMQPT